MTSVKPLRQWAEQVRARGILASPWVRALALAVLLAALGAAVWLLVTHWQAVRSYAWTVRWWPLLVALPLYPLAIGLVVYGWVLAARRLGAQVRFGESFYAFALSNLARKLPTPVWFLGGRILLARSQGVPEAISSAALVIEQALMLLASIVVALVAGLVGGVSLTGGVWRWALLTATLACLAMLARPALITRAINAIMRRLGSPQQIDGRVAPADMARWLALFVASGLLSGLAYCCVVLALHPTELALWPALISFSALGSAVSFLSLVLPAGLGLREAATATLLASIVPVPVALAAPILSRLWFLANELLWAAIVTLAKAFGRRSARHRQNSPNG